MKGKIHREYYMVAHGYKFYLRVFNLSIQPDISRVSVVMKYQENDFFN